MTIPRRALEQDEREPLKVGLRFRRGDRRVLVSIRDLAESRGQGDVTLYNRAIEAAESGEPMIVLCDHISEVQTMASLFSTLGVHRPAIESLSGVVLPSGSGDPRG
jgi:hypothetical protein